MGEPAAPQGIDNFRDFGGFSVAGGGRVASGRLLRSAQLGQATDADLDWLAAFPVSVIVDLRRPKERLQQAPSRRGHGFDPQTLSSDEGDGDAPHIAFLRQRDLGAEALDANLTAYYRAAPFELRHRNLFARAFAALAEAPGAMLVHCTGGKDRTGLLAALIRSALGGDWQETQADYLLTNAAMLAPERRAKAAPAVAAMIGAPADGAIVEAFLGVQPHRLQAAFDEIDARCGSLNAYLASLGADAALRARLAERLVVG